MSSASTVYVFGSSRIEKLFPALENTCKIVYHEEVIDQSHWSTYSIYRKIAGLKLMNDVLSTEDTVAIVDGFDVYSLLCLFLCNLHDCEFLIRVRGGMWNEYSDYLRNSNTLYRVLLISWRELIRDTILEHSDRIIVVSYFTRMQIVYELDVEPEKIEVIYEPIDPNRFENRPSGEFKRVQGFSEEQHLILLVTNFNYLDKVSGIRYFLPGIQEILAMYSNWQLVIAGDGKYLNQVRSWVSESISSELYEQISFIGYCEAIEEAFVDSEIVFHLSFRDTVGYTVLEAQAAGKPVIVNPDGGMPEVLPDTNRKHQIVREPDDLTEAVSRLIENKQLRDSIGAMNRTHVEENFDTQAVSDAFASLLYDT